MSQATKATNLVDVNFGLSEASLKVLEALKNVVINVPSLCHISTSPFYNGRENSIALSVNDLLGGTMTCVVFGRNRNTNDIFVDVIKKDNFDVLLVSDFTNEMYKNRKFFKCDEIEETAQHVVNLIKTLLHTR